MTIYCLRSCNGDDFAIGLYTSLENCIVALKTVLYEYHLEGGYSYEEMYEWYYIRMVETDIEPTECIDILDTGIKIEINADLLKLK